MNYLKKIYSQFNANKLRIKRIFSESGWIVSGSIVGVIGSLALVKLLTESLSPAEYGRLTLALTLGTLVCQVGYAGSMPGIMRYYTLAVEKKQVYLFLHKSLQSILIGTVFAIGLGILTTITMYYIIESSDWAYIVIAIIFSILLSFSTTITAILNAARKRQINVLITMIDAIVKLLVLFLVFWWFGTTVGYTLMAYVFAILIVLALQIQQFKLILKETKDSSEFNLNWQEKIWNYSKPFVIINVFTWAQASSDRWALETITGTTEVGLYAVLLQLGWAPIALVTNMMITLFGPIIFNRSGDAQDESRNIGVHNFTWKLTHLTMTITGICFSIGWLVHPYIFSILVGSSYHEASYLLPWMILAGGMFSASQVLGMKLQSELRTGEMLYPKVISSVVGVFFCFVGAYWYSLPGVVGGMVCFSLFHLLWFICIGRRVV